MEGRGVTDREIVSIIRSMENLRNTVEEGFTSVNESIAEIHKEYNTRVTKLEVKAEGELPKKVLLSILFATLGWLVNHLFTE